ncbi:MAG: class I adenylate-forming enzyme family protein [Halorientalis sp.]
MPAELPWAEEYREFGIPETLEPYPEKPVHSLLEESAQEYPEQIIVHQGAEYTYEEVVEMTDKLANALGERGVEKGERVATILPTSLQFLVSTFAISKAGGVHIPNDFLMAEDDLVYRLRQGDPEVLIGVDHQRDLVLDLADELDVTDVILTELDDFAGEWPADRDTPDESVEWLPQVIDEADPDPPEIDFDPREDVYTLMFTGGTTGRPKGCLISHFNMIAAANQAKASQSRMANMLVGSGTGLNSLPAYHVFGYLINHVLTLMGMNQLLVSDPRDTSTMIDLIESYKPMLMSGVPTQYMELVKNEDIEAADDIIGITGAAPLSEETKSAFSRKSKGVSQGYGMTEMSSIATFNVRSLLDSLQGGTSLPTTFDQQTVGVPVPDVDIKLRDVDSGEEIPLADAIAEEREGELLVNGPNRMLGYLGDRDAAFNDEGYIETGDVAKIDEHGRFYIVDRVKDMINVSGLKVYTEQFEEVLVRHEGVELGAAIGVPDPERPGSELVKAFVEPKDDADPSAAEIESHLDGDVPKHAMPTDVEFVEEMPLTAIGKTDKQALREREGLLDEE